MSERTTIRPPKSWIGELLPFSDKEKCKSQDNRDSAQSESIDSFEDLIWRLAAKFTNSKEESEAAANEIFADIKKYSEPRKTAKSVEDRLTTLIALRTLIKRLY